MRAFCKASNDINRDVQKKVVRDWRIKTQTETQREPLSFFKTCVPLCFFVFLAQHDFILEERRFDKSLHQSAHYKKRGFLLRH